MNIRRFPNKIGLVRNVLSKHGLEGDCKLYISLDWSSDLYEVDMEESINELIDEGLIKSSSDNHDLIIEIQAWVGEASFNYYPMYDTSPDLKVGLSTLGTPIEYKMSGNKVIITNIRTDDEVIDEGRRIIYTDDARVKTSSIIVNDNRYEFSNDMKVYMQTGFLSPSSTSPTGHYTVPQYDYINDFVEVDEDYLHNTSIKSMSFVLNDEDEIELVVINGKSDVHTLEMKRGIITDWGTDDGTDDGLIWVTIQDKDTSVEETHIVNSHKTVREYVSYDLFWFFNPYETTNDNSVLDVCLRFASESDLEYDLTLYEKYNDQLQNREVSYCVENNEFVLSFDKIDDSERLTKEKGRILNAHGREETWYDLDMVNCYNTLWDLKDEDGEFLFPKEEYPAWIDEDGFKKFGPYNMVAANWKINPLGTFVYTSAGTAIVADTGGFVNSHPTALDIATNWTRGSEDPLH